MTRISWGDFVHGFVARLFWNENRILQNLKISWKYKSSRFQVFRLYAHKCRLSIHLSMSAIATLTWGEWVPPPPKKNESKAWKRSQSTLKHHNTKHHYERKTPAPRNRASEMKSGTLIWPTLHPVRFGAIPVQSFFVKWLKEKRWQNWERKSLQMHPGTSGSFIKSLGTKWRALSGIADGLPRRVWRVSRRHFSLPTEF